MITVQREACRLLISGHAGYAEAGKDIVCAAVTVLTETLVKSLEELTDDEIKYDISPGRADIQYKNLSERGLLLVDSFFMGFCLIEADFSEYIKII